ncbi:23S ribosomal RNA methyltransferase Erm [Agromyces sp. H3Y2-19a]|uniref:23S ribosomal RNA methyltransferase Erm n=1 Tax=Agromyces TaxID=33877 RepID=UPI001E396F9B|nr:MULTISPECIES: 23S ribosomal RNA methyltransferase Erm [Agromyces]MCD5345780.1 23S ribosomal RNA methyltransferase Erm [Agromyces sp. S2-1-8]MDF0512146.1 23S ribosomal RNA methyltransferase Erm [Agromyces chromiiresistens]
MHTPRSSSHSSRRSSGGTPSRPSRRPSGDTAPVGGRHELGQNFLVDRQVVGRIVALVAATHGPIVELGAGGGALTHRLAALDRPLTAIEIDPARAEALRVRLGRRARIVTADALDWRYPAEPHVVVGNIPFHVTTAMLRMLLARHRWTEAVLLTQWEAARRRCGVGGTSQLTVQWAPWYEFDLDGRVPRAAFRPAPSVDGGLFTIRRRRRPLVPVARRRDYQAWVADVFGGRTRALGRRRPRDLGPEEWVGMWAGPRGGR